MSPAEVVADGSKWPLVTIVTPTYNQADFLAETIDSVLAQDYPNIEYIVIDDGSTDQTREILRRYDGRIRWESQDNMGQAATLNKGWAMGSGEIVGYLSSDDLLKPNAVSEAVRCLRDHPEVVLVYPDFELIDATGRYVRTFRTPEFDYKDMLVNLTCHPGPGAYFRKALLRVTGGWNCTLKQIPDLEFWIRLSQHGAFKRIPIVLASSRIHEASQSFRAVSMECALEPVVVINSLLDADQLRLEEKGWAKESMSSAHLLSFRLLWRSGFYSTAVRNLARAVISRPALLVRTAFWRIVVAALTGKAFYRLLVRTGSQGEL